MDDLISRQAAIDAIDVLCQEHRYRIPGKGETYSQYNEAWQDSLDRAEGAIFNLPPAQPEPHWIPVSERLPEEPGYYITSNEYNGVGEDFYYDGHFWNADKNAYSVIAWMPKPKAYKPNNK